MRRPKFLMLAALIAGPVVALSSLAVAEEPQRSAEDLAKALANPVAALVSVPLQLNFDQKIGSGNDGERWTQNVQPVLPFELNADWNLISRTILPLTYQDDVFPGVGDQSGIGDVSATFVQPFVTDTTFDAWSYTFQTESTYDWEAEQWSVPINAIVSKVKTIGGQLVSVAGGVGFWAESPDGGTEGLRFRLALTLLFPR